MAEGRQIYFRKREIDQFKWMIGNRLMECDNAIENIKNDLHWARARFSQRGPKPVREDFSPLLPDPEADYVGAVERWMDLEKQVTELVEDIEKLESEKRLLRGMDKKAYYYGD